MVTFWRSDSQPIYWFWNDQNPVTRIYFNCKFHWILRNSSSWTVKNIAYKTVFKYLILHTIQITKICNLTTFAKRLEKHSLVVAQHFNNFCQRIPTVRPPSAGDYVLNFAFVKLRNDADGFFLLTFLKHSIEFGMKAE